MESIFLRTNIFLYRYIKRDFYSFLGYSFFFYFFILSIIFYEECIINYDNASELSFILSGQGINPVYFRWGVIPFRVFVIIGPYLNFSLQTTILLTSCWFIVFKFIGWLICQHYFKNTFAGLLIIASIILSLNEGFYAQVLQMYDASLYFCMLFAVVQDEKRRIIKSDLVRAVLTILLLILIKGTHLVIFLICPLLFIYYASERLSAYKIIYFVAIGVISGLYLTVFIHPYEGRHMSLMWIALNTKGIHEVGGIFLYLLREVVSLDFLIPLIGLIYLLILLIKSKKYTLFSVTIIYISILFLIAFLKLVSADVTYPLSEDVTYFTQASFYATLLIVVALLFYEISITADYKYILNNNVFKTIMIFIVLFYTSEITLSGMKKMEHNKYLEALMKSIKNDFSERIFIINPNYFPYQFSKLNINAEYETLMKSNINMNTSIVFYITPFTVPIVVDRSFPNFANCVYQINKSNKIDLSIYHFRTMNPSDYFKNLNPTYFRFDNYKYRVLEKKYMDDFNQKYGFSVNEY